MLHSLIAYFRSYFADSVAHVFLQKRLSILNQLYLPCEVHGTENHFLLPKNFKRPNAVWYSFMLIDSEHRILIN